MRRKNEVTERRCRHALVAQILNRRDVAESLCHLGAVGEQKFTVAPEPRERLPCRTLRLGYLILVVRKNQIDSAGMNIQRFAEVFHCHRRALEMPPGAAAAPWGIPRRARCLVLGLC